MNSEHTKCSYLKCSHAIGIFLVILFAICFAWYYINPVEQDLHLRMFRLSYFGFEAMDTIGFILGAIQTYLWAYIVVGIWSLVGCCLRPGTGSKSCCEGK